MTTEVPAGSDPAEDTGTITPDNSHNDGTTGSETILAADEGTVVKPNNRHNDSEPV
jgi:hypothetical protein